MPDFLIKWVKNWVLPIGSSFKFILLLSANFDLNNVVYTDCNEENIKNETMNLILYAEGLNDIVFDEDNTLKTLKRKCLKFIKNKLMI